MTTNVAREHLWINSEAADAFFDRNGDIHMDILRAVARLAEDTDEAEAILAFVNDLHRDAPVR